MTTKTTTRKAADAGVQDLMDLAAGKRAPAKTSRTTTAKKAAPAKPASKATAKVEPAAEPKPLTRPQVIEALHVAGYPESAPTSYTVAVLRDVAAWLTAGANPGDESIPLGVLFAMYPHLKETKAKASDPIRTTARDLRAAIKDALDGGDADRVVGLAQSLRDLLKADA